jgi:Ras-related protein Rab-1A
MVAENKINNEEIKQEEEKPKEENNKIEEEDDNDYEKLPTDYVKSDYNYKVIVIGDSGVGKTCLTNFAVKGEFMEGVIPTVGYEFYPFVVRYKDKIIKLEIWDTCGQEKYRSLIDGFYNSSSLAVIVYAINEPKSFDSIDEWIRQCKIKCSPETKLVLIGNKADLDQTQ